MKTREIKELANKPADELHKMVRENKEKLRSLQLDLIAGKVKNVAELNRVKKDIARMLTFLNKNNNS